jgi:acetyl-CoA carboxylase biotin carboxyl carrier protein
MKAIENTDVTEVTYEENGIKIQLKRGQASPVLPHVSGLATTPMAMHFAPTITSQVAPTAPAVPEKSSDGALDKKGKYKSVTSPFVGTFYRSPAPSAPAFVQEGQEVHPGDVLCIVEAMKLMNEIESDVHARVARIQVGNGTPVEFAQELFLLEILG